MQTPVSRNANHEAVERTLIVNGVPVSTSARTLAEYMREAGFTDGRFATAHNGSFIPQAARGGCDLTDGDTVEILTARQGG